jgi:dihydropteroate synthase
MGILNVTPDSFSDAGRFFELERAVAQGIEMAGDGADIIDVGGESTRPYSRKISAQEEMDRVIPVIESLRKEISIPLSVDTYKARVALEALKSGASMINDVSSLRFDPEMARVAAEAQVPVFLMHIKGTPGDMQDNPTYEDLIPEIIDFLKDALARAVTAGIKENLIIVDPGIGFGKSFDDNLKILKELSLFRCLKRPLLLGTSNKAFIGHVLDRRVEDRDTGSMATFACGVMNGAHIVRAHNVRKAVETVKMVDAIMRGRVK